MGKSNVNLRRAVGRPDIYRLNSVKKACSVKSLELEDANLSTQIESSGEK